MNATSFSTSRLPARTTGRDMQNLDLLRALAVLCVFTAHLINALGFVNPGSLGRFGVVLFFVHTSFVLMCSLSRLESQAQSASHLRLSTMFFIRRFFRIYPLAIVFVSSTVLFHIPPDPFQVWHWIGIKGLLANLALVQNLTYSDNVLAVLWSLPLEVQMYALLPLAYFFLKGRRYASVVLWILSLAAAFLAHRVSARLSVFLFAPCFISGVLAFDLIARIERKLPAWLFLPVLLAITISFGPLDNVPLALPGKLPLAWGLSVLVGLLIAACKEGNWPRLHPVAHWIAERSYGIYLSHMLVFWLALDVMRSAPAVFKFVVLTAASVALPLLVYRWIEKPLINVGSRLASRLKRQARTAQTDDSLEPLAHL